MDMGIAYIHQDVLSASTLWECAPVRIEHTANMIHSIHAGLTLTTQRSFVLALVLLGNPNKYVYTNAELFLYKPWSPKG